jgi:uncharacterized membrane protein YcaP (DUF421 family)
MEELIGVALRVSVMYLYVLAALRLSGKRSIGNLSPLDFVVATIVGDMFDDVFWAEIPLSQGLVGLTTILLLHMLTTLAESRSPALRKILSGEPTLAVEQGAIVEAGLRKERTIEDEVYEELRGLGLEKNRLGEVASARWEPSGELSVIRAEPAEPVQKQDVPRILAALKGAGK